ncbi:hypothetical protein C8Q75DRAFT_730758 [Abortiporus biennis]|nr:hypothetical protein C8Q75DRAFT_730753 [Abortiporus biennis]KAI0794912.1 hypothetical protein C8Q75DRAFT_730758 [Abortiporus biennis]
MNPCPIPFVHDHENQRETNNAYGSVPSKFSPPDNQRPPVRRSRYRSSSSEQGVRRLDGNAMQSTVGPMMFEGFRPRFPFHAITFAMHSLFQQQFLGHLGMNIPASSLPFKRSQYSFLENTFPSSSFILSFTRYSDLIHSFCLNHSIRTHYQQSLTSASDIPYLTKHLCPPLEDFRGLGDGALDAHFNKALRTCTTEENHIGRCCIDRLPATWVFGISRWMRLGWFELEIWIPTCLGPPLTLVDQDFYSDKGVDHYLSFRCLRFPTSNTRFPLSYFIEMDECRANRMLYLWVSLLDL